MRTLLLLLSILGPTVSLGQGAVRSYWQWGGNAGATNAWLHHDQYQDAHVGPTFGVTGGYSVPALRLSFLADLLYTQRRFTLPLTTNAKTYSYLTVPLSVRTGAASERVHLQLGVSFSKVLSATLPVPYTLADWQFQPRDWAISTGLDVRIGRVQAVETTLGPFLQYGIGPTLEARNPRYREGRATILVGLAGHVFVHRHTTF
ncbi:hypothetical protein [Hymenobacter sp. GOD-10R]|uniref:hypothetical protein n=1 Tax=Hymenobacter sp. GOD-10R TaxID=3093922 RepID=UPI002D76D3D1|nr:hypothetical protein [Hymenobacter sp. GOD-10R]WRQ31861.1 hypothetical protein SD425_29395 [Hymenobacter sp. GOD-10R]